MSELDEQIYEILDYAELFFDDSRWEDREKLKPTHSELKQSIERLIANQVREARIDELERLELRLCKSTQYGIPVVDLQSAIDDRIAELQSTQPSNTEG